MENKINLINEVALVLVAAEDHKININDLAAFVQSFGLDNKISTFCLIYKSMEKYKNDRLKLMAERDKAMRELVDREILVLKY